MVISETGAQGHILHPAVRPGKKLLRTVNPKLLHIIGKTDLHLLFEKITEIGRIHLRRICRILEADLLFIMFPDKLQSFFLFFSLLIPPLRIRFYRLCCASVSAVSRGF